MCSIQGTQFEDLNAYNITHKHTQTPRVLEQQATPKQPTCWSLGEREREKDVFDSRYSLKTLVCARKHRHEQHHQTPRVLEQHATLNTLNM